MSGQRFIVELRCEKGNTSVLAGELAELGAQNVPGFEPVPMAAAKGVPATVCFTVSIEDPRVEEKIRGLSSLVQIYGDPKIGPFR